MTRDFSIVRKSRSRWVILLYLFLFLQCTNFFCWLVIPNGFFAVIIKIESIALLLFLIVNLVFIKKIIKISASGKYVVLFSLCTIISAIPCYIYHGQSFVDSFKAILPFQFLLLYFVFYKYNVSEKQIATLLINIALCKFAILFFQQFTYPDYWFSVYQEGDISNYGTSYVIEIRSGIYRYLLGMIYILYFAGLYLTSKYLDCKDRFHYLILFVLILMGIYLEQFRFNMLCFLLCWLWLNLKGRQMKISIIHLLIIIVILYTLYANFDLFFGDLKDKTERDLSEDYIRVFAYTFYLFEYWKGPLTLLFGNGCPLPATSSYGKEITNYYEEVLHYFRADIGLLGTFNTYGVLLLLILVLYIYRIYKNWKYIDSSCQAFLIWLGLMVPLFFPIHYSPDTNLFMAGFIYIMDCSVQRNKLKASY